MGITYSGVIELILLPVAVLNLLPVAFLIRYIKRRLITKSLNVALITERIVTHTIATKSSGDHLSVILYHAKSTELNTVRFSYLYARTDLYEYLFFFWKSVRLLLTKTSSLELLLFLGTAPTLRHENERLLHQ